MDLGEKKEIEVGVSHRHALKPDDSIRRQLEKNESEEKSMLMSDEVQYKSFRYNRNGVKCTITPNVTNAYGNVNSVLYEVEVATFANDDQSAYMEGEWEDSSSFSNYAGAVEWAMEQIQRRMRVHNSILESLGLLGMMLPQVMLEDGHGDEEKYEEMQNGMDEEQELESIFTFDEGEAESHEENPNEGATVLRKI